MTTSCMDFLPLLALLSTNCIFIVYLCEFQAKHSNYGVTTGNAMMTPYTQGEETPIIFMKISKTKSQKATMCPGKRCNHELHHVDFTSSGRVRDTWYGEFMYDVCSAHKLKNHEKQGNDHKLCYCIILLRYADLSHS